MKQLLFIVALTLVGTIACSGSQPQPTSPPVATVEKEEPKLVTNDPFDKRLNHFETTYKALVCRANRNYDPMGNIGLIIEPFAEMKRFLKDESTSAEPYELVIKQNGYESTEEFFADRDRIMKAKRGWWKELTGRLFDFVEECAR